MSKKTKKASYQGDPGDEHVEKVVVETPVVESPLIEKQTKRKEPTYKKAEDGWEIKDRIYRLTGSKKPLSRMVKSANVYYFDEE